MIQRRAECRHTLYNQQAMLSFFILRPYWEASSLEAYIYARQAVGIGISVVFSVRGYGSVAASVRENAYINSKKRKKSCFLDLKKTLKT